MDNWYSRVKEEVKQQQEDPVWMSEDKVREVFILTFVNRPDDCMITSVAQNLPPNLICTTLLHYIVV